MAIIPLLFSVTFLLNFHLFVKNKIVLLIESEILEKMFLTWCLWKEFRNSWTWIGKNFTFIFIGPVERWSWCQCIHEAAWLWIVRLRGGLGVRQPWGKVPLQLQSSALPALHHLTLCWSAVSCLPARLHSSALKCFQCFVFGVSAPAGKMQSSVEREVHSEPEGSWLILDA